MSHPMLPYPERTVPCPQRTEKMKTHHENREGLAELGLVEFGGTGAME
jgi:hypothetical protein